MFFIIHELEKKMPISNDTCHVTGEVQVKGEAESKGSDSNIY